ncbi:class I SAM-dependent methyltransferase [Nocardioides taihuensis]|uniref:Class I SAM-dependent methyltransferase n=1 Tax=Nocardioides taihuensis TaxID=1835606 RepID=A0ABW0BIL7_9ACTN
MTAAGSDVEDPFREVFARALRGEPCSVVGPGGLSAPLPVGRWNDDDDAHDASLLRHCRGATIDVGCGPGRLVARLARLGHVALGIDVVPEAVRQARERGAAAIVRDVFDPVPGEGRWDTALLADGNIGIGGDPERLLRRVRALLAPGGRVVVEVAAPGTGLQSSWAALHCGEVRSRPFRWAVVGGDAVAPLARDVDLEPGPVDRHGDRWSTVLRRPW